LDAIAYTLVVNPVPLKTAIKVKQGGFNSFTLYFLSFPNAFIGNPLPHAINQEFFVIARVRSTRGNLSFHTLKTTKKHTSPSLATTWNHSGIKQEGADRHKKNRDDVLIPGFFCAYRVGRCSPIAI